MVLLKPKHMKKIIILTLITIGALPSFGQAIGNAIYQNMLDAPFYSRAAVQTTLNGQKVTGVHEALDLKRFRSPLLKPMLAVRVPRRAKWSFD